MAQSGNAKTQELASVPKAALPRRAKHVKKEPTIMRVMAQADAELKDLKTSKARTEKLSPVQQSKVQNLHTTVDSTLQQLMEKARKIGINVNPVDKDFRAAPAAALARAPTLSAGDNDALFANDADSAKLATPHFTSFALTSTGTMRTSSLADATQLDDGAIITGAGKPVARIAIPLGAHQDATKDRKEGRSWSSLRKAPKATIQDKSTEATAMRADGTHHKAASEVKLAIHNRGKTSQIPRVHMPHVI